MSQNRIQLIKGIPILQVADRLQIAIEGTRSHCVNPKHPDHNPSMSFNIPGNYWHCFGCGVGGSNIDLVMVTLSFDCAQALSWLEKEFLFKKRDHSQQHNKRAPAISTGVNHYAPDPEVYQWLLDQSRSDHKLLRCLCKRGLSEGHIRDNHIVAIYAPQLQIQRAARVFGEGRVARSGLALRRGDQILPVWWKPIIVFPFYDLNGDLCYLQARQVNVKAKAKYLGLHSIPKPVFNQQILSGLKDDSRVFIVEGVIDALSLSQLGLNALGLLGSNTVLDSLFVDLLKPFRTIIIPDNDPAGIRFSDNLKATLRPRGIRCRVHRINSQHCDVNHWLVNGRVRIRD